MKYSLKLAMVLAAGLCGANGMWQKIQKEKKQWNQWRRRCAASAASCVIL